MTKILHQIWIGGDPPPYYYSNRQTFSTYNRHWQLCLWEKRNIEIVLRGLSQKLVKSFNMCENSKIAQADLARLCIVYVYGGLYADLDIEFFRDVEPLFRSNKPVFFREAESGLVTNSIFYSCPNTKCLANALAKIEQMPNITNSSDVMQFAGPEFLTQVIEKAEDVDIKRHIYFEYSPVKEYNFQYGYHRYDGSWL